MRPRISWMSTALILLAVVSGARAEDEAMAPARTSARAWLALLDEARYEDAWKEAGELLQAAVSREEWSRKWAVTRLPLGSIDSRAVRSSEFATTMPRAPEGEYAVLKFDTAFENGQTALETVILRKESDGMWRVSGYFIR
jgi:hypothetical protein